MKILGAQENLVEYVGRTTNTIGYAGLDVVHRFGSSNRSCAVQIANLVNKAGKVVGPSVDSAQAAVRASASQLMFNSSCSGFGLCGDLIDGPDDDVWPITAVTVRSDSVKTIFSIIFSGLWQI